VGARAVEYAARAPAFFNLWRLFPVFFYGLFMDESLLREKGLSPEGRRPARV